MNDKPNFAAIAQNVAPTAEQSFQPDPNWRDYYNAAQLMRRHTAAKIDKTKHPAWSAKMQQLVDAYYKHADLMAALIGPRGTGKTQSASVLVEFASKLKRRSRYCTVMEFFRAIKGTFGGGNEREEVNKFLIPDLLILDEVQVRSESAWENNLLTHLVDQRYGALKSTIFICNLSASDFSKCVGDSIHSRISQTGGIFVFDNPSWRE